MELMGAIYLFKKHNIIIPLVFTQNYKYSPILIKVDVNTIYGPYFVVGSDAEKKIVLIAKDGTHWLKLFTLLYDKDN